MFCVLTFKFIYASLDVLTPRDEVRNTHDTQVEVVAYPETYLRFCAALTVVSISMQWHLAFVYCLADLIQRIFVNGSQLYGISGDWFQCGDEIYLILAPFEISS